MSQGRSPEQLRSIARFQITKSQYLLFAIAFSSIAILGLSTLLQSNSAIRESKVLSDVETPAASIIFTQRETLVYATRLAQWSNGGTTRRNVQIARNILAQRLAVIDTSGRSMGSRAKAPYWKALRESDAIVAAAQPGILPESVHMQVSEKISPIIDEILSQSRELIVSYQRSVDETLIENARNTAERNRFNLILLYIFVITGGLFLLLNARTNFKNYRIAREAIIDEQKRLDETIDELHRTQATLTELQNLNEAKNAFISTINHELRTPLTSIIGYIDVIRDLQEKSSKEDISKYLDVLDRNAEILLHLVESILSLSKIDASTQEVSKNIVDLNQVIDNVIFMLQPATEKSRHTLTFTADGEKLIRGDAGQLSQVFVNVVGNAIKFSPEDSTIEIKLESVLREDGIEYARASITDHGIGIPEEDLERLFTRFFRAKNADSGQYPGTGLGLVIVKEVVNRHNGKIEISSILGQGTTFTVDIPLHLTSEDLLIRERRGDVLNRAITSLNGATPSTIKGVTHDIGGAIGFYGFESEGAEILNYSRALSVEESLIESFELDKAHLLELLKSALERVSGSNNG
jgi:signal transduction histidine kinase